jgi:hypothetical protein
LKILIATQCFPPDLGGIEHVMGNIAIQASKAKHTVFVVSDKSKSPSNDFDDKNNYLSKAEGGISPRNNFDEVWWSLITIFQVLLGEGWNEIMYDCMRTSKNQFTVAIYFFILVIFGNVIMLNLFLAILLGNFEKARNFG